MSDAAARQRATTYYERNQVIVAGAGSGKTSLVVERLLCQMVERDLPPERVAAITFTDKAAAEMRGRLRDGLTRLEARAREDAQPSDLERGEAADRAWMHLRDRVGGAVCAERCERILRDLAAAHVTTIHGFCSRLLRAHPLEADVDSDFRVDEGLIYTSVCRDRWEAFLGGDDGPDGDRAGEWADVLERIDIDELEEFGADLARFRLARTLPPERFPPLADVLGPALAEDLDAIDACIDRDADRGPSTWLAAAAPCLRTLLERGADAFRDAVERATCLDGYGKPRDFWPKDPPGGKKEPEAADLAKRLHKRIKKLRTVDDAWLERVVRLLRPYAEACRDDAVARGILPYDALLVRVREMLEAHPELRRRIAARFSLIAVDELQDTDPLQYEIVFWLAEDPATPPSSDAWKARLEPGKLLLVGDPKQAIYRFRGADIAAYRAAVNNVVDQGGERLVLTVSWRSVPEVTAPLERLLRDKLEGDPDAPREAFSGWEGLESGRPPAGDGPRVELWQIGEPEQTLSAEAARRAEAEVLANEIATLIRAGQEPGEIAILLRALTGVDAYTRALRERGVHTSVQGGSEALERPEFKQVVSLLRALIEPSHAPAVLAVLRSPLGATSDAELAHWSAQRRASQRWLYPLCKPDPELFPNLARTYTFLRHWERRLREEPADAVLALLREDSVLRPLHAAAWDGSQRLRTIDALFDSLAEAARNEPAQPLVDLLDGWLESHRRRQGAAPEPGTVRVLSIHAAKGLEFERVFLPDLGRPTPRAEEKQEVDFLPTPPAPAIRTRAALSAARVLLDEIKTVHERAELARLMYVACTRAREHLVLFHTPRRGLNRNQNMEMLAAWGQDLQGHALPDDRAPLLLDPDTHPGVCLRFMQVGDGGGTTVAPAPGTDPSAALERARAIAAEARQRAWPLFRRPTGLKEDEAEARAASDEAVSGGSGRSAAALVGTIVHETLERWDPRDSARLGEVLARTLAASGARIAGAGQEPGRIRDACVEAIERFESGPLAERLRSVEVVARELPVLYRDPEGVAWSGTLDLLYVDPDDQRLVVADYKTDRDPDLEARAAYRSQLEVYARGIAQAFPERPPPRIELWFTSLGEREVL